MTLLKIGLVLIVIYIHSGWAQKLRVASLNISAPYLMGETEKEGFIPDMLNEMGLEFEFVSPEDGRYGQLDNGAWTGMMGMAVKKEVDLIGADLTMTSARAEVVDFTPPFMSVSLTILSKEASMQSTPDVTGLVFAPFTAHLWILVLVAYLITSLVFWLTSRINPKQENECILESLWCIASSFVYVSRPSPEACSRRVIVIGWWIFAIITFVAYAVNLQPFVTASNVAMRYQSVEDMLSNPDFKFGAYTGGSTYTLLQNSPDDIHKEIFSRLSKTDYSNGDWAQALNSEEGGTLGIIMESNSAEYIMANHCDFYTVGNLATRFYGLALPKESPHLDDLSTKVLKLSETGMMQVLKTRWWPSGDSCQRSAITGSPLKESMAVDIPQLSGAFILLLVFLLVGLADSIWELISAIKKEPELGPLSVAIKEAFCGCLPKKKSNPEGSSTKKDEEANNETGEKQNGAETMA